jgi:hypothetical protein
MPSRAQPKRRPAVRAEDSDTAAANMHSATIRQRLRHVQGGAPSYRSSRVSPNQPAPRFGRCRHMHSRSATGRPPRGQPRRGQRHIQHHDPIADRNARTTSRAACSYPTSRLPQPAHISNRPMPTIHSRGANDRPCRRRQTPWPATCTAPRSGSGSQRLHRVQGGALHTESACRIPLRHVPQGNRRAEGQRIPLRARADHAALRPVRDGDRGRWRWPFVAGTPRGCSHRV